MAKPEEKKPIKKPLVKKPQEPVKPKEEIKPQLTLKDKIDQIVEKVSQKEGLNKEELKKELFNLIQRILYPDQFCPKCEERLFFDPTGWVCPNCGFRRTATAIQTPTGSARPSERGPVPPQVEKMIQDANENMKEPRRVVAPTSLGSKIRKLVDQRDTGGPSAPTPQDEAAVRRDKNVSNKINWV